MKQELVKGWRMDAHLTVPTLRNELLTLLKSCDDVS